MSHPDAVTAVISVGILLMLLRVISGAAGRLSMRLWRLARWHEMRRQQLARAQALKLLGKNRK